MCGGIRWIGAWSLGIFCINPLVIYLVRLVVNPRQLLAELPVWTQIILPIPGALLVLVLGLGVCVVLSRVGLRRTVY